MRPQRFRQRDREVVRRFLDTRRSWGGREQPHLRLGWSNWGFGTEALADSAARLARNGVAWVELHGNHYGPDLGYRPGEVVEVLEAHGLRVSGICGMVTAHQELASNRPHVRQRFVDYVRREIEFCRAVGGTYVLFGAAAVGRPVPYDGAELDRSAETLAIVAEDLAAAGLRGALEPIRPDETTIVHTFADAEALIERVGHPGVQHINGDLYHMLAGERHIGETLLAHGDRLVNLHLADTNRRALGSGLLDLDLVIMALYAAGHQHGERYCTAEPLGAGSDPYQAMYGPPDVTAVDALVAETARTWQEREEAVLAASDDELLAVYDAPA